MDVKVCLVGIFIVLSMLEIERVAGFGRAAFDERVG